MSESKVEIKGRYRPEIDGLRAFAVVAVIINHFNKDILPSGYLGVDIFFVISGYVITSSLAGRESKNFYNFITGFYQRRLKRLLPALILFILITGLFLCTLHPNPTSLLRTGLTSLVGLSNLYLYKQSTDYFSESTLLNPFTHTWSLGVEEQFYFLFPLLVWFTGFGKQSINGRRNLLIVVISLTIFSLIGFVSLYQINQPAAYFLMPSRFWEMSTGCIVFLCINNRSKFQNYLSKVPPIIILCLMIWIFLFSIDNAVISTILIVFLSSLLIICLKENTLVFNFFTNRRIINIGLMSYSLYLWHWGILSFSRWTIGFHWWTYPLQIYTIYILSYFSYKFIETPIRKLSFSSNILINILYSLASLIISISMFFGIYKFLRGRIYLGNFSSTDFEYVQKSLPCERKSPIYQTNPIQCLIKTKKGNVIWLFGNSHASNLVNSLKSINNKFGYEEVLYLTNPNKSWIRNDLFKKFSEQITQGDLIIFSYRNILVKNTNRVRMEQEIKRLIEITKISDSKLILVNDLPSFGETEFLPNFTLFRNGPVLTRKKAEMIREEHTDLLKKYIDNKNVYYIDQFDIFCSSDNCPAVVDGNLLYADGSPHLNEKGSIFLQDLWLRYLPEIIEKR